VAYSPPPGQPYYGPQPPYSPYQGPYPAYSPAPPTNGLAIASLVCGVGAFVIGLSFIPAIICGHIARRQIRRTGEQGGGMALAGLILGYIGGALFIVVLLVFVAIAVKAGHSGPATRVVTVPFIQPAPAVPALRVPVPPVTAVMPSLAPGN
jgi:Domain of unknown function (DUF4190)